MNLKYRKLSSASEADLEQFNILMEQLLEPACSMEKLMRNVDRINSDENKYLMVVEDVDKKMICGTIMGVVFDDFCASCDPLMVVENVVVHSEYQQKGIGRAMFAEMEKWGKSKQVQYALLVSDMERTGAHDFYRKIGCKEVKGFKKYL